LGNKSNEYPRKYSLVKELWIWGEKRSQRVLFRIVSPPEIVKESGI
jgi:hypothetical protein